MVASPGELDWPAGKRALVAHQGEHFHHLLVGGLVYTYPCTLALAKQMGQRRLQRLVRSMLEQDRRAECRSHRPQSSGQTFAPVIWGSKSHQRLHKSSFAFFCKARNAE